ncbi:MAG TPA: hypothetical protein PK694_00700 [Rhodospirillales bacterium]|jgi:hypothetical protein|nr:hypothetical protein [Rhodospirillales bacterium]
MAELHVVTALIAKRAELAGQLEAAQAEVRRLVIDLDNVDATLRIFKPDIELDEIKPKPLSPRSAAYTKARWRGSSWARCAPPAGR